MERIVLSTKFIGIILIGSFMVFSVVSVGSLVPVEWNGDEDSSTLCIRSYEFSMIFYESTKCFISVVYW